MLVMKVDKELSTKECIEYAEQLSKHLDEKVVILDKKVISFERLKEERFFIPIDTRPLVDRLVPCQNITPYDIDVSTTWTSSTTK